LGKAIEINVATSDVIVKAMCVLHNLIIDKEGVTHNLRELTLIPSANNNVGGRPAYTALHNRDVLKLYICRNPVISG